MNRWTRAVGAERRTRPCMWCGRPVRQPPKPLWKLYCDNRHWLNKVRDDFWHNLFK